MLSLSILIILVIGGYIWLRRILEKSFLKVKAAYNSVQAEYEDLILENKNLKDTNSVLIKAAEETTTLYDITKEICKSLDEDKVFSNFSSQINKYIEIGDCKFLKGEIDLSQYKDCTILPLKLDKGHIGYLIASQIKDEDRDKFHILAQQFLLGIKRTILYEKVQELAITDSLTAVSSRRYLMMRLNEEIERSKKFKYNFSFLMTDVDHFKDYNDRYGHLVGDAILREVSKSIKENIRQIDLVARYGGEEFSVILTETDKDGARFAAERIRQAIGSKQIKVYDEDLRVTISIGISVFAQDGADAKTLIDCADQALYRAKGFGRNRVCLYR